MSIGYGGGCRKYGESAEFVIYEYYAYDWNTEGCDNPNRIYDGIIKIEKSAFIEPEIHQKIKPNQREKISFQYDELSKYFPKCSPQEVQRRMMKLAQADYQRRVRNRNREAR